jgi:hypothetical protein
MFISSHRFFLVSVFQIHSFKKRDEIVLFVSPHQKGLFKMTDITPATQVDLLSRLPALSDPAPHLASGTVALFQDDNWISRRLDLRIDEYVPNQRQTILFFYLGQATFVAFNLAVGTVMTLMDNVQPVPATGTVADGSGCGPCIDLVGTGKMEAVDLWGRQHERWHLLLLLANGRPQPWRHRGVRQW